MSSSAVPSAPETEEGSSVGTTTTSNVREARPERSTPEALPRTPVTPSRHDGHTLVDDHDETMTTAVEPDEAKETEDVTTPTETNDENRGNDDGGRGVPTLVDDKDETKETMTTAMEHEEAKVEEDMTTLPDNYDGKNHGRDDDGHGGVAMVKETDEGRPDRDEDGGDIVRGTILRERRDEDDAGTVVRRGPSPTPVSARPTIPREDTDPNVVAATRDDDEDRRSEDDGTDPHAHEDRMRRASVRRLRDELSEERSARHRIDDAADEASRRLQRLLTSLTTDPTTSHDPTGITDLLVV